MTIRANAPGIQEFGSFLQRCRLGDGEDLTAFFLQDLFEDHAGLPGWASVIQRGCGRLPQVASRYWPAARDFVRPHGKHRP
jgi:hypothetical protein